MNYTLKNGRHIELAPEDLEGITWMCWKQTFRDMAEDFVSQYSSVPNLYTEDDKDELAERITNYFFCDEDLDNMKIRHAEAVTEEMDEELETKKKGGIANMCTWRLTCSIDADNIDYEEIITSNAEPDYWTCYAIAESHGCQFFEVEEVE